MDFTRLLIVFATSQLFIGPLSDKIGRRPVIFSGLILLGIASLGATFAPSIELLIIARILQALGGCATLVVPRAIVQDVYIANIFWFFLASYSVCSIPCICASRETG